jgi:hypothetical protein
MTIALIVIGCWLGLNALVVTLLFLGPYIFAPYPRLTLEEIESWYSPKQ